MFNQPVTVQLHVRAADNKGSSHKYNVSCFEDKQFAQPVLKDYTTRKEKYW
jgi:hypothetical protein